MARKQRIHIPGAFYHITQRGNNQQRIFFSNEDRAKFCLLMQEGTERFGHRIHAFCLMDNHIHLLVQAGDKPLGKAMQNLTFRYAKRLNKKCNTTGHRFQGRYFSGLIDTDEYLHEVLKYIHLNPVKAKMVNKAAEYMWSSHNHYVNVDNIPWVYKDFCLSGFSANKKRSIELYESFMATAQCDETVKLIAGASVEYYIGSDEFSERVEKKHGAKKILRDLDIDLIARVCCEILNENIKLIQETNYSKKASYIRGIIGHIIIDHTDFSLSNFARYCNKTQPTISRSVKRVASIINHDSILGAKVNQIVEVLSTPEALDV